MAMSRPDPVPVFAEPADLHEAVASLTAEFTALTGQPPRVVAAAPGRVNLIGEHLDYNGGCCLPIALPHTTVAAVAARADARLRIASRQVPENPVEIDPDRLRPGAVPGWAAYVAGVVWALRDHFEIPGLDVLVDGRVPLGAGLSSSAALECAVALAVNALLGQPGDTQTRTRLASACVRAETEMAGAPTGGMDQAVALLARKDHALLLDFADDSHEQIPWRPADAGLALLVVDTRVAHELTDGGYGERRADCEEAARQLGVPRLRAV
jgi:galactokinase